MMVTTFFYINILVLTPLTDYIALWSFFHSVGRNGSGKSNFFYGMLSVYFSQAFIFTFLVRELINGLDALCFYCFLSYSVCPQ